MIQNDSHHLIKYLHLENEYSLLGPNESDFEELLELEHQAKLAIVKSGEMEGENFSKMIEYFCLKGLKSECISEIEIYEIVDTYLSADRFVWNCTHEPSDGFIAFSQVHDIRQLWKLVRVVPKVISSLLIEKLPTQDGNYHESIPEEVLDSMSDNQLISLLYRPNVNLAHYRKKRFLKLINDSNVINDSLLSALISRNFELQTNSLLLPPEPSFKDEFYEILCLPKHKISQILTCLVKSSDCKPIILFASSDYLLNNGSIENSFFMDINHKKRVLRDSLVDSHDLRDLKLYTLAKMIMPWEKNKPESLHLIDNDPLCFLLSHIKWGNTWQTYRAFHDAWYMKFKRDESTDELLPDISF